jgi:hypothetical protein
MAILSWVAPGDNGNLGTASRYTIQYSTQASDVLSFLGQVWTSTRVVSGSAGTTESETITGLTSEVTYYFAIKTFDQAGNSSSISNVASYLTGQHVGAQVIGLFPPADISGVVVSTAISIQFNKTMVSSSLNEAFSLVAVLDKDGQSISQIVGGTVTFSTATKTLLFSPTTSFLTNTTYDIRLSTVATDILGRSLSAAFSARFTTLWDHSVTNTYISPQGWKFYIPTNAFASDGYIRVSSNVTSASAQTATHKLLTVDPFKAPVQVFHATAYDSLGNTQQPSASLLLTVGYSDTRTAGIIDGTTPSVRANTLSLWWLNESLQNWVRIPGVTRDAVSKVITSPLNHFSTFALIGGQDMTLDNAFAYPVPYVPAKQSTRVITFQNLSSEATIRIFTLTGNLVRTIHVTGGSGTVTWDVKNGRGEDVASGLYPYVIENASVKKTGELVIVR